MVNKAVCPVCEEMKLVEIGEKEETTTIKGQEITAYVENLKCTECGEEFVTSDQMERNTERFRRVYRRKKDIISPQKIRSLRKEYGVSQKTLARILDFGELTINSYEQGSIPSGAHNNLLKLIQDPENFKRLLEERRDRLSNTQLKKINAYLLQLEDNLSFDKIIYSHYVKEQVNTESEYNGYTATDVMKTFLTIQCILYYSGRKLYKMSILKLLFYVDFLHFKKYGKAITGWPYAHLPYGPVPQDYKSLMFHGEERNFFVSQPDDEEMGEMYSLPERFSIDKTARFFSKVELDTIREVADKLADKTATGLKELTHKERAWTETGHTHLIPYTYAAALQAV